MDAALSDREFDRVRRFIHEVAGIALGDAKKALVCGRLGKRLAARGHESYDDYLDAIGHGRDPVELQLAVDLLTTNETYFFREPPHFEFLERTILPEPRGGRKLRVWSAACSSGEEPYSIAMLLADKLGPSAATWEVMGSDISLSVLERARSGLYPMDRAKLMPPDYLKRFCLKGTGPRAGTLLVDKPLRSKLAWFQANLNETLPDVGEIDVVFLRNVMIYFDLETKRQVVRRLVQVLRPGGWFFVSHSENLHGITEALEQVRPSVFRKPRA